MLVVSVALTSALNGEMTLLYPTLPAPSHPPSTAGAEAQWWPGACLSSQGLSTQTQWVLLLPASKASGSHGQGVGMGGSKMEPRLCLAP